jgi:hypothetical protein
VLHVDGFSPKHIREALSTAIARWRGAGESAPAAPLA